MDFAFLGHRYSGRDLVVTSNLVHSAVFIDLMYLAHCSVFVHLVDLLKLSVPFCIYDNRKS